MLLIISIMTLLINCLPCPSKELNATKILRHLRQNYEFVRKTTTYSPVSSPRPPARRRRSTSIPGTDNCPWTWERDDNPDRVPRTIVKAVCPGCDHHCRSVSYTHKVLVVRCDKTTGYKVWKWKQRTLAIAFVYDPY